MEGDKLQCKRCLNVWVQRYDKKPKFCPGCKSPFWEKPLTEYWKSVREKNKLKKSESK